MPPYVVLCLFGTIDYYASSPTVQKPDRALRDLSPNFRACAQQCFCSFKFGLAKSFSKNNYTVNFNCLVLFLQEIINFRL